MLTFMDAYSGYNQIRMHGPDQEKTSFITNIGTYSYIVMPFGLKNMGATYQRLMNRMFKDQLGKTVEVYIDDMLIKSRKAEDHLAHMEQVFEVLNRYEMKLNPDKCTFGDLAGKFLGHLVTSCRIEANPDQIQAIIDIQAPTNLKGA